MSHKTGDRSSGWERAVWMRDFRRDPTARAQARQMLHSGFRTAAAMHLWCATHFIEPLSLPSSTRRSAPRPAMAANPFSRRRPPPFRGPQLTHSFSHTVG